MHILVFCHYYPPEVNAPASRTSEHAQVWAEAGHKVTVITCAPNHPAGKLFPGYRNSFTRETIGHWEISGHASDYLPPTRALIRFAIRKFTSAYMNDRHSAPPAVSGGDQPTSQSRPRRRSSLGRWAGWSK